MRRVWLMWLTIGVLGTVLLAAPGVLWAQNTGSPIQAFIIPPVMTNDNDSTLGVTVSFRLLDAEGNSVGNVRITDLKLKLHDMPPGAIDFGVLTQPVERITSPIYVTILIDTSGSMDTELPDVRSAALTTIEQAPDNVMFRVVTFSGQYGDPQRRIWQDFTGDRNRLRAAIDSITEVLGGTCYYDAIYNELDSLASAGVTSNAPVRRALMAFTDGRDMVDREDVPCSSHSLEEVIQRARTQQISIYTLGLSGNLDEAVLTRLANNTRGMAIIGVQSELNALFTEAFADIVNQYEAEFSVLPAAGRNRAQLEIWLANPNAVVTSAIFEFDSPRNYITTPTPAPATETPLPPTATSVPSTYVRLDPAYRDTERNQFVFPLSISNPRIVERLFLRVLAGSETKYQSGPVDVNGRNAPNHEVRIDINVFEPGREYTIQVIGVDMTGHDLLKPMDNFNKEPDPVLAELEEFKVELEPTPTMTARINSVTWALPESDQWGKFTVELVIDNQQEEIAEWRAYILDESNNNVMDTDKEVFKTTTLIVPMPSELLQPVEDPQPRDYKLYVNLWGRGGAQTNTNVYEIKDVIGAVRPGFFAAIWIGVNDNPLIAIAIVVVISSIMLYFVFGRKPARPTYSLARSAEEYTVVAGAASSGGGGKHQGKLLVDVFETPSPGVRKRQSFNRFPCVIGRSSQCDVRLTGDSQISRRHAQLSLENGRILLTDLGSNNGTFVDEQPISANTATPLSDGQVIRLGRQTLIRVCVSY